MSMLGKNGLLMMAALLACWTDAFCSTQLQPQILLIVNFHFLIDGSVFLLGSFIPRAAVDYCGGILVVAALNAVKNAWNGQGALSSWVGNDPCGSKWNGIVCNEHDAVIQLKLVSQNLSGTIPAAIGDLSNLEALELWLNPSLGGELPAELGSLQNLKYLSIQQCAILGSIPVELTKLRKLQFIALNVNQLKGSIPREIGLLKELLGFGLLMNKIGGILPVSSDNEDNIGLDNLTSIRSLLKGNPVCDEPLQKVEQFCVVLERRNLKCMAAISGDGAQRSPSVIWHPFKVTTAQSAKKM